MKKYHRIFCSIESKRKKLSSIELLKEHDSHIQKLDKLYDIEKQLII